jgi:hypothetical protein
MTNGQQRPANPNRISVFRAKPFPDGRPPTSEFSVNVFLTIDMLFELMDALQNGVVQPEDGYHGVQGVTLWGNGYRGPGENGPVIGGTINTHKAIWQAKQRQQQADPIYPGQPVAVPQQQQVAPAYAAAFPPQAAAAPVAPPPAAPAPTPTPRPHPVAGGQWSTAPAPAASGWKSAAGALDGQKPAEPLPY